MISCPSNARVGEANLCWQALCVCCFDVLPGCDEHCIASQLAYHSWEKRRAVIHRVYYLFLLLYYVMIAALQMPHIL